MTEGTRLKQELESVRSEVLRQKELIRNLELKRSSALSQYTALKEEADGRGFFGGIWDWMTSKKKERRLAIEAAHQNMHEVERMIQHESHVLHALTIKLNNISQEINKQVFNEVFEEAKETVIDIEQLHEKFNALSQKVNKLMQEGNAALSPLISQLKERIAALNERVNFVSDFSKTNLEDYHILSDTLSEKINKFHELIIQQSKTVDDFVYKTENTQKDITIKIENLTKQAEEREILLKKQIGEYLVQVTSINERVNLSLKNLKDDIDGIDESLVLTKNEIITERRLLDNAIKEINNQIESDRISLTNDIQGIRSNILVQQQELDKALKEIEAKIWSTQRENRTMRTYIIFLAIVLILSIGGLILLKF